MNRIPIQHENQDATTGADWPVGLSGDRPVGPSEIFKFFSNTTIQYKLPYSYCLVRLEILSYPGDNFLFVLFANA